MNSISRMLTSKAQMLRRLSTAPAKPTSGQLVELGRTTKADLFLGLYALSFAPIFLGSMVYEVYENEKQFQHPDEFVVFASSASRAMYVWSLPVLGPMRALGRALARYSRE